MNWFFVLISRWLGADARSVRALTRAFLIMDLRQQHYAAATATRPSHLLSPLFLVVAQCLTMSAAMCLILLARVEVFFFAFANLTLSLLVLATTIIVEFHEIVLNPDDLDIIRHRPISSRTYTLARLLNLGFYWSLMYLALNLLPILIGAGLKDAGWWYAPAYLLVSGFASLIVAALTILLLSMISSGPRLEAVKNVLAWTQILLILVVGYGGQFMLRDTNHAVQMWAAKPPSWATWIPTFQLASLIDRFADHPRANEWLGIFGLFALSSFVLTLAAARLNHLYANMDFSPNRLSRTIKMPQVGRLTNRGFDWLLGSSSARLGFWLGRVQLRRDTNLLLRCLLPLQYPIALVVLGTWTGQFSNPCVVFDPTRTLLPSLAVFLCALAVPVMIYQLAFCADYSGSWLLMTGPLGDRQGFVQGIATALIAMLLTPLALILLGLLWYLWRDESAAALHAILAWLWCWPAARAGVWLVLPAPPFSVSTTRGVSLGLPPLPFASLTLLAMFCTSLHTMFAHLTYYWPIALGLPIAIWFVLEFPAGKRLEKLWNAA